MRIPRRVARFNRVVTNPVQRQWAWLMPPWALIWHRGRRSGRLYRTPVVAFKRRDTIAFAVLYGERSDWVQNVLAGGGRVVRGGRTFELDSPRLVSVQAAEIVSPVARTVARLSGTLLVCELGERVGGFGPGGGR